MLFQLIQDNSEMLSMFFSVLGIHEYIINEYYYKLVKLRHED
jgi:hypothetical protein